MSKSKGPGGRRIRLALILPILAALLFAAAAVPLFRPLSHRYSAVSVVVPSHSGLMGISRALQNRGIIRNAYAFAAYARYTGRYRHLRAGRYRLSPSFTLDQITAVLLAGPRDSLAVGTIRVTIPEGYTLRQIADLLQKEGVTNGPLFLKTAMSPGSIAQLHAGFALPKNSLEGYLFPDTYIFKPNRTPLEIDQIMVVNFFLRFVRPYQQEIAFSRRNIHQVVTMASLIEREAKVDEDRRRIAGVLENRLHRKMKLQIDASLDYAYGRHIERLTYRDLKINSPYNTYMRRGLPPGPIANPGMACLEAAIHPEKSEFLYYVAPPGSGTHIFSRTFAEHQAVIKQIRAGRQVGGEVPSRG